jgi:hypothetical protein
VGECAREYGWEGVFVGKSNLGRGCTRIEENNLLSFLIVEKLDMLHRLALPVTIGAVRYPDIKIHDKRIIRLLEVLPHGGSTVRGWTAKQIHQTVLTTFRLSASAYSLNQLRYDLRKLKGHGLLERDGARYAYQLTTKGV